MDWFLVILLRKIILKGELRITTAGRARFALGDGTGIPVAIRFTTRAAEWGVLALAGGLGVAPDAVGTLCHMGDRDSDQLLCLGRKGAIGEYFFAERLKGILGFRSESL